MPWLGEKCASKCGSGFNFLSHMMQCKGSDSYTRNKFKCVTRDEASIDNFFCRICKPQSNVTKEKKIIDQTGITKVAEGFKCDQCCPVSRIKANLLRHIKRKHELEQQEQITSEPNVFIESEPQVEESDPNVFIESETQVVESDTAFSMQNKQVVGLKQRLV